MTNEQIRKSTANMIRELRKKKIPVLRRWDTDVPVLCDNGQDSICIQLPDYSYLTKEVLFNFLKEAKDTDWISVEDVTDIDGCSDGIMVTLMREQKISDREYYNEVINQYEETIINVCDILRLEMNKIGIIADDQQTKQLLAKINKLFKG